MPEFLTLLPLEEALEKYFPYLEGCLVNTEQVSLLDSLDRISSTDIKSEIELPSFTRSTVDGFAVKSKDTHGASDSFPGYLNLIGEIPMGKSADLKISSGEAVIIHTGGMVPEGADAVIMMEYTQVSRDELEIYRPVSEGENIIRPGEDIKIDESILSKGVKIRPFEIGGLAATGRTNLPVYKQPVIGIISSGDEVIPFEQSPKPGQVRDINSQTLSTLVRQFGAVPKQFGIIADNAETLKETLKLALDSCDMVIITAGSSASERDHTARVISEIGQPGVLVHGVNIKPGKPTILAVCNKKPVIGLPGNPVSALVISLLFVKPTIEKISGLKVLRPLPVINARLKINVASRSGREEWMPVKIEKEDDQYWADPIFYKSNLIFKLSYADGLMKIPAEAVGLEAGQIRQVLLI